MTGYIRYYGYEAFKVMWKDRHNKNSYIDAINGCYCQAIEIR